MIIKNADVFTEEGIFKKREIFIDGEKFSEEAGGETVDAYGCYAIPGLVDIHLHGCRNVDFSDGSPDSIKGITTYEASQGVTTVVPATMTLPKETLMKVSKVVKEYRENFDSASDEAELFGINMEGPFVSKEKCGAQNPAYLHAPDYEMFSRLNEASGNAIRLCDIAPELPGAMDFIEKAKKDAVISIAHTTADYETAREAIEKGASHVTHLYNAMPGIHHRKPGVIPAAAENDDVIVELIADGIHIEPSVIRLTFRLFGRERIALISDSMMATGLPDGEYALGGQPVTVRGKLATLHDGTIAGSATNLMDCMKNAVLSAGIPLYEAVYAATVTPAKSVGCFDHAGSIRPGKPASLVLLKKGTLETKAVFLRGHKIV
ncbi:MAG: N-acetylglucosamine-6-phosphate deacetylase [Lachnospiraceae bacterium]|nr:N-acetylglucosamine-6-phosphate deacetylase [Lachnospiraceae bacterium]